MKIIEISSFLQGYANASSTSEYAVKTPVFSMIPTNSVTVSFEKTTEKNIRFAVVGYADPKPENLICEYKWYTDNPKTFDLSKNSKAKYWVVVFQNSDGSKISPSDMASTTVTIENLWYIDGNGDLHCDNMPYAPSNPLTSPYPSALWRVSEDVLTHEAYPKVPEKTMSKPYPKALWRIDYISPNAPYNLLFPNIKPIHTKAVPQHDYIIIYDKRTPQDGFDNNGLAVLEPIACTVTEVYNAEWTVTLEHPIDRDQKWKYIQEFNILKVLDQLFVIKKIEHSWTGNSGKVVAYAEHIFYHLNDRWIFKGADIYAESGYWLVRSIIEHAKTGWITGNVVYSFNFYSDITSENVGFDMGQIGYYKWNPLGTAMTPLEMLLGSDGFTENFGGELYRDNFYFSLNQKMENSLSDSFDIHVGLNLIGIQRTVDTSSLCTDFTAWDKFGSGSSVYWTVHSAIPHHVVRSQEYSFSESYTQSDMSLLGWEARKYFGQHCQAQIDIAVDLKDVKNNPEYREFANNPRYKVGDSGRVYDERLETSFDAHIIRTVKDGITGENLEVLFSSTSGFTNMDGYDIIVEETPATPPESTDIPEEVLDYEVVNK